MMQQRVAVVLFNLGGPDQPSAVRPFLYNLFSDRAIIRLPAFIRIPLAWLIALRRAPLSRENYALMGGGSPLLPNTRAQAEALENRLDDCGEVRVFTAMRYWHPMAETVAKDVAAFAPQRVVLLPLYPQFSTTTSASSRKAWMKAATAAKLNAPTQFICCYPAADGFLEPTVNAIRAAYDKAQAFGKPRVLFSAHGLPQKIIAGGDPYQMQCELTARAIVQRLKLPGLDWVNCYQSRVGPLQWIGPETAAEIARAGETRTPLIIASIAFVSEHIETLVELDHEYAHLAEKSDVPSYTRIATPGTAPAFIDMLASAVREALQNEQATAPACGGPRCAQSWVMCPCVAT